MARLNQWLKDVLQLFCRNPLTCIHHLHAHFIVNIGCGDNNFAFGSVLNGIADQVIQDLL
ncbi:Uncharacterised protein [Vibrio cholerae]|uniref:Uncharacterized protein n=1 Tax=Vibrio cholerae TaxID=666 RepID=A0A655QLX5_VIBCL|nr:Uncharacterised protein [Vibrio cholerae]CSA45046.1 Uncharacterised protein [Vibrio cholerae]CSA64007.1 Uncharacterised protein [Vibrio cholerae]CSA72473.1 Uncharacterised protein [Vibrio cholerae]CSA91402.1 Uncharacterised protein [Vibrio cholerae]